MRCWAFVRTSWSHRWQDHFRNEGIPIDFLQSQRCRRTLSASALAWSEGSWGNAREPGLVPADSCTLLRTITKDFSYFLFSQVAVRVRAVSTPMVASSPLGSVLRAARTRRSHTVSATRTSRRAGMPTRLAKALVPTKASRTWLRASTHRACITRPLTMRLSQSLRAASSFLGTVAVASSMCTSPKLPYR